MVTHIFNQNETLTFWRILDKQDPVIQCTIEDEDCNKSVSFLTINITNSINDKYYFEVHRKDIITDIYLILTFCVSTYTIKI